MEYPRLERVPQRLETCKAFAEHRIQHQVARYFSAVVFPRITRIPDNAVANAAEAPIASRSHRLKHRLDTLAEREIGIADDAGELPRLAVSATRAHGSEAVGE